MQFKLFILISTLFLSACSHIEPRQHASLIATDAGLNHRAIDTRLFSIHTYSRIDNLTKSINIYIEGDGLAWITKTQISSDPSPRRALALQLAALDMSENVLYIARPCQFHDFSILDCSNTYWTDKRFSNEVIESMNDAIDTLIKPMNHAVIHLIGYSGGGAIAVLIASHRKDVASIRTVAGNLDHARLNQYHRVSLIPESLNPISVAQSIAKIPQLHFIGDKDKIIPKFIAESFISQQGEAHCAHLITLPNANHEDGWIENWHALLTMPVTCNKINQ